jgi:hypothetical protein
VTGIQPISIYILVDVFVIRSIDAFYILFSSFWMFIPEIRDNEPV